MTTVMFICFDYDDRSSLLVWILGKIKPLEHKKKPLNKELFLD